MRPILIAALLILAVVHATPPAAQVVPPPASAVAALPPDAALPAVRFAVIGDNGTGEQEQYDVGTQMFMERQRFPFEFVLMLGDNIYSRPTAREYAESFELPYAHLLEADVPFYAVLGNHDADETRFYDRFNMGGERYYTYARDGVRFFALDSNRLDDRQLQWFEAALRGATEPWKIAYFHHAIYSNGSRHGSNIELRVRLEPLLVRYGVNVVFSGHDHHYERLKPQKGITYFVAGASGKLRKGGVEPSSQTAAAFAEDQSFMLVEIVGHVLSFRTLSRTGRIVDSGVIHRQSTT